MIHVAVLGYGTVGSGVVEVIETNKEAIDKRAAAHLNIKYILDLRDFPGDPYESKVVHDYDMILKDPEVAVICETMGGIHPAYEFSRQALLAGKSVCTSNKELVASHGPELISIARENHCNYLFEASVGGGIPIIRPLNYSLTAEKIDSITGILNGTTNYILTKMDKEGADFEIYTEGITKISAADFRYARQMDKSIKLLAMSRDKEEGFFAMVAPFMISKSHPLYSVSDVFNAVYVHGNMLGDSMYYGRGAGKLPTASAVVSDVVDCARHIGKTVMCFWENEDVRVADIGMDQGKFFVRVSCDKREEAMEAFGSLAEINVGITEEFAFMTQVMTEKEFNDRIQKIGGCINRIRIMSA